MEGILATLTHMLYFFSKTYWKLSGWQISGPASPLPKKLVLIAGPHTSWKDVVVGLAASTVMNLRHLRFLGKKELFTWPAGWLFRKLGGIPVNRTTSQGLVEQVVDQFKKHDAFVIGMMPEGTRKKVTRLRTGFYHIAQNVNVPIVMVGLDFAHKKIIISEPFFTTDDQEKDFAGIFSFFAPIQGRHPKSGLAGMNFMMQNKGIVHTG